MALGGPAALIAVWRELSARAKPNIVKTVNRSTLAQTPGRSK
jgi:hypothetical protein